MASLWAERVAAGRCGRCGRPLATGERATCDDCREYHAAVDRKYRGTERRKASNRRAAAADRQRLIAAGLCIMCREPSEVREDGRRRQRCIQCTGDAAVAQAARVQARRATTMGVDLHPANAATSHVEAA